MIADRDDEIKRLGCELIHRFRAVARNIDPDLGHRGDRFGPDTARPGSGGQNFVAAAPFAAPEPSGHLAARGIAGAKNQDALFVRDHLQHAGPQQAACAGFTARTNALMNLPSTDGAIASTSIPLPARNSRASWMR